MWAGGAFLVWGGSSESQRALTDGARYDPRTNRWQMIAQAPVTSWRQQQLIVAGDDVILLTTAPERTATTIRASAYDPARNSWTTLPDLVTPDKHDLDQVVALGVGTTVFVWSQWAHTVADAHLAGATTTNYGVDAFRLDTKAGNWSRAPVKPDEGLTAANPLWTGQGIVLPQNGRYCGGCSGPPVSDPQAVVIDPYSGRRRTVPTGPVTGACSWTGGALIVVNSSSTGGPKRLKAGETAAFDPVSGRWTMLKGKPANTAAEEAVQIWTGDRLIVWGLNFGPNSTYARGAEFAPPQ